MMRHLYFCAAALAAAFATTLRPQALASAPGIDLASDLLAAARLARRRGAQAEFLACGYRLRDLAPDDPAAPLIIAAAHGSLGPSFAKDVAAYAFARVLALTQGGTLASQGVLQVAADLLADGNNRSRRINLEALRDQVRAWQADLAAGKTLLLAPDKATLARQSERAERRVEQVASFAASERKKIARIRKQLKDAERALEHERTRKRVAGEGFRDLQPYLDRIASCSRAIATSERLLRAHEKDLKSLRAEAKRLAARLRVIA